MIIGCSCPINIHKFIASLNFYLRIGQLPYLIRFKIKKVNEGVIRIIIASRCEG